MRTLLAIAFMVLLQNIGHAEECSLNSRPVAVIRVSQGNGGYVVLKQELSARR